MVKNYEDFGSLAIEMVIYIYIYMRWFQGIGIIIWFENKQEDIGDFVFWKYLYRKAGWWFGT